jgi:hypothetical protein
MISQYDAERELETLEGEIALVTGAVSAGNESLRADLERLEAKRRELRAVLQGYLAQQAETEKKDRAARLRAHVGAYNALVRKINAEIVEIRANLPREGETEARSGLAALQLLREIPENS